MAATDEKKIVSLAEAKAQKTEPLEARAVAAAACGAPEHQQKLRQQLGGWPDASGYEYGSGALPRHRHQHRGVFRRP